MSHSFVTVAIPFDNALASQVDDELASLGNPAQDPVRAALDATELMHFMSITVVRGDVPAAKAHLIIEMSADGAAGAALARVEAAIGDRLLRILRVAGLSPGDLPVADYLGRHQLGAGQGWFSNTGLPFTGVPGMTVSRIKREAKLARRIAETLDRKRDAGSALATLNRLRAELFDDGWKWAFVPEPAPILEPAPKLVGAPAVLRATVQVLGSAVKNFLWPFVALVALACWLGWHLAAWAAPGAAMWVRVLAVWVGIPCIAALVLAGLALALVVRLRRQEEADASSDADPQQAAVGEIMVWENRAAQNHLAAVSTMKPGLLRRLTLRLAFWIIRQWATYTFRPGFLADIGSIHFARWILIPGTDKLLFLSNYGGSWESYLEDFIEKAHEGLTAVWSNTVDFPKTRYLFKEGATDGDRFKRWARRQQHPTLFWYSAYPDLTMARIRTNAAIRQGLGAAKTEAAAAEWLARFGAAPRPVEAVESVDIQTLVFGGLSRLRFGTCLLLRFADDPGRCRSWLDAVRPRISFGDGSPGRSALLVAFSATGLRKLGLEDGPLSTFPVAFQHGMSAPWRARALGDIGVDDPHGWCWGGAKRPVDAVLLVYADHADALDREATARRDEIGKHGHDIVHEIRLKPLPENRKAVVYEPFGFADGISQPILRGTRRWKADKAPNDVIEPGEIILGYPDNRGYIPPSPTVAVKDDPEHVLPSASAAGAGKPRATVAVRDLGRNGTYLVVRQLEQDVAGFDAFLAESAASLAVTLGRPPAEVPRLKEWIAAKMVGRWRNGTSLVRHPHAPGKGVAPDNDFLFGLEDPDGQRCPLGAHIRRSNPRDSFDPGSQQQLRITNRHRILRVGRVYEPQGDSTKPGLAFMCLNADIERQFEFVQQSWVLSRGFHGLANEIDPIVGHRGSADVMTVPMTGCPVRLKGMTDFVTVRGGGYFFMPGKRAIAFLSRPIAREAPAATGFRALSPAPAPAPAAADDRPPVLIGGES